MELINKAGASLADSPFTFVLSTGDVDRMGDVVEPTGINLTAFKKNPVALFAHQSRFPIGTWENIRRDEGNRLMADLKLAARGTSRLIDELRSLIEQKILRAASIGFGIIKAVPLEPDNPRSGIRYVKTELLEASLVAVPANANALALRSLSAEARALFLEADAPGTAPSVPASHAATAATLRSLSQGPRNMNIAQRIAAAKARLTEIDGRVNELKAVAESVDNLSDEHATEVETLTGERATVEKNLANLEKLERLIGDRAEPVINGAPSIIRARTRGEDDVPGTLMARLALANVYAHIERRPLSDVVRERFAHDQRVEAVMKSQTPTADTTTAGWAKELVRVDIQGFMDILKPVSVYAAAASRGYVVNFGDAGSISLPYRGGTNTDVAGAFVGENGAIPVKRATIGASVMNRYKMAVITTLTKELARASTPQAESLLRRFMADDTAIALDKAFIDAVPAVAGTRPAGILAAPVVPIAASVLATPVDKAIADLKALLNAMIATGNGTRPVFLMNPAQKLSLSMLYSAGVFIFRDQLAGGQLMGADVVTSITVPAGDVILIDAANLATGLGTPEFDASDTATLVMANADAVKPTHATNPADDTALGTAEQVPPDGGIKVRKMDQLAVGMVGEASTAVSMFQVWGIALRTVLPVSWMFTRPGSVQWIDNVGW